MKLREIFYQIISKFRFLNENWLISDNKSERSRYLLNWFSPEIYKELECIRLIIEEYPENFQAIFKILASDILRDYSQQEPKDLRIRRRYSPFPKTAFIESFIKKVNYFLDNLEATQCIVGVKPESNLALLSDSRNLGELPYECVFTPLYDGAITSPPYLNCTTIH